jgi:hypothetical protein
MLDQDAEDQPEDWLHMEIEVPRYELSSDQAALAPRPKRFYGVNRDTVVSVLETHDALPGTRSRWLPLLERFAPSYDPSGACATLAAIRFRDFPNHVRIELEAIVIPVAKLTAWLSAQGLGVPSVLVDDETPQTAVVDEQSLIEEQAARSRGRPQKPSWPRVAEIVRQLHAAHPEWNLGQDRRAQTLLDGRNTLKSTYSERLLIEGRPVRSGTFHGRLATRWPPRIRGGVWCERNFLLVSSTPFAPIIHA